ncbi:hypothetical protein [Streptomyces sp. ST2-7A]|uniref:hypothetical protein n=1 Tax=Streptomyces sp. ST2-7A TaxID=2907214 RepID=UPI0035ABB912
MPWVSQWHHTYDPEWESVPADDCGAYLNRQLSRHRLTDEDLTAWPRRRPGAAGVPPRRPLNRPPLDED